jgi:hypothetical protein
MVEILELSEQKVAIGLLIPLDQNFCISRMMSWEKLIVKNLKKLEE